MKRRWSRVLVGMMCLAAAAGVTPVAALADGLPLYGLDVGNSGIGSRDGVSRFVTIPAHGDTIVARIEQDGGRIAERRTLDGNFTIPAVAYDGSASGLSADGSTLVLIRPRESFPRGETTFAIVNATGLRVRDMVRLDGDFSFDAISPDGTALFLVHYLSTTDPTVYEVRVYDLVAGRLTETPIIDPTEPDEDMGGTPVARVSSPDGRWEYTLYVRKAGHPFIHALDTVGRTARCIDLDGVVGDISPARLAVGAGGATIELVGPAGPLATVDTATFAVADPSTPPTSTADDTGWLVPAGVGSAALLALPGVMFLRRWRSRRAGDI